MSTELVIHADVPEPQPKADEHHPKPDEIEIGQWFWVKVEPKKTEDDDEDDVEPRYWLGCVLRLGSNYAYIEEPEPPHDSWSRARSARVHFEALYERCIWEPNAKALLDEYVRHHHSRVNALMGKMQEVTARLCIAPQRELRATTVDTQALSTSLSDKSYNEYRAELVKAKQEELPQIFKAIEIEHKQLAKWMSAELLPLRAQTGELHTITSRIESRIFNVQLYAGLVEEIVKVKDGEPAALDEKLTLLQRRHYMDEECLARYETGGMQFKHLEEFDAWLAREDNLNRLLPFPRCMLAFRVRRHMVEREVHSFGDFIQLLFERRQDSRTFLYIRNGQKFYRMCTEIDFGYNLFPDMTVEMLSGKKLWAIMQGGHVAGLITDHDYQERLQHQIESKRRFEDLYHKYAAEPCTCTFRTPADEDDDEGDHCTKVCEACSSLLYWEYKYKGRDKHALSYRRSLEGWMQENFKPDRTKYEPFDKTSVYYDDMAKYVQEQMEAHNRIALVVQGLLDRSECLHPHPPWQIWTAEGYEQALRLIYDDARALTPGSAPDFEAYRQKLNASLKPGCVTIGQFDVWLEHRRKERERVYASEDKVKYHVGDPGPPRIAEVKAFKKSSRTCVYEWSRQAERMTKGAYLGRGRYEWHYKQIPVRTEIPANQVLNVSAYTPGDFKQFFEDPRTRANYLQWAPLLLAAEEWYAGNKDGKPRPKDEKVTQPDSGNVDPNE